MRSQFESPKQLFIRLAEVLLAFCLVFVLSAIWSRLIAPMMDRSKSGRSVQVMPKQEPPRRQEGLVFDPAKKTAFVRVRVAGVFVRPDSASALIDELVFGREVDISDWDKTRRFVQVTTAEGLSGYMQTSSLTYIHDGSSVSQYDENESERTATVLLGRYFGDSSRSGLSSSLGYLFNQEFNRTSSMLTLFQRLLLAEKSKSAVNFKDAKFGIAIVGVGEFGSGSILFPEANVLMSQIRRLSPGVGVFLKEVRSSVTAESGAGDEQKYDFKSTLSKEVPALYITSESSRVISLKEFHLNCVMGECGLSLQGDPQVVPTPIQSVVFGDTKGLNPKISFLEDETLKPFGIALIDLDDDNQNDVAVYSNQSLNNQRDIGVLYVAYNDGGRWLLSTVQELRRQGQNSIVMNPEPGSLDGPVVVQVSSKNGSEIAYSVDGSDPSCPSLESKASPINQVDLVIEKTSKLKIISCTGGEQARDMVSATFAIK